ncbi:uncharacterized protein B0J16DRAFT_359081 [Fusarium flagelliforme]|uniref:uncharacterized protein n=1 Tax=Fusarium flagelliforme TaxID=2675880 RepID=UPI001E8D4B49|nr:uncharacterized protein B0J16DRAFT_359081 [Fusarium flagelliforme]KAH7169722.1 hypothetical protein B0J16DRAFT_359081 [Fusarium flagelliforme]
MVLGILTAIAACPAIIGTTEAIRQGQRKNAKEQHRGVKSNLIVSCRSTSPACRDVDGCAIVLRNNKLYIAVNKTEGRVNCSGHLFADWGRKGEGLVSTIYDEPPQLNWIYVDQETYEVKYGLRVETEHHLAGPWDCTRIDKRITLEGWEGFMAVEEDEGSWALYFDRDDNGLAGKRSKERFGSRADKEREEKG